MTSTCEWDRGDCNSICSCPSLGDGVCDISCNTWSCGFDRGDCAVCKSNCNINSGSTQSYGDGTCSSECNDPLCDFDDGDCSEHSAEIYVSSGAIGRNKGSWDDPFLSLSDALTFSVANQLTVWLLKGEHKLLKVSSSISVPDSNNPLSKTSLPRTILIKTLRCSASTHPECASDRATLKLSHKDFTLTVSGSLELNDLILDGQVELKTGCAEPSCLYCPSLVASGSSWKNDRGQVVDIAKYAEQSACDYFKAKTFMTVKGTLKTAGVTVQNFRQQLKSLIEFESGAIFLKDTDFLSLQTSASDPQNAVISMRKCTLVPKTCGTLEYEGGSIKYLNNGYELSTTLRMNGFLHGQGIYSATLKRVTAAFNWLNGKYSNTGVDSTEIYKSLIELYNTRTFIVEGVDFVVNFAQGGLIYFSSSDTFPIIDQGGFSKEHLNAKVSIVNSSVADNTTLKGYLLELNFSKKLTMYW